MKTNINILVLLFVITFLVGCDLGKVTIISEVESINNIKAILYSKESAPSTETGYHITILGKKEKIKENMNPNVFRSKIDDINIEWEDENTLLVTYNGYGVVYQQEDKVEIDGEIIYIKYNNNN